VGISHLAISGHVIIISVRKICRVKGSVVDVAVGKKFQGFDEQTLRKYVLLTRDVYVKGQCGLLTGTAVPTWGTPRRPVPECVQFIATIFLCVEP
jgi:hypothetical protein